MKKVYYLSTCTTCQRIIKMAGLDRGFEMQDIKTQPLTPNQLDELAQKAGSYEALFSRMARKYKALNLKEQALGESDYRRLILEEYTFLKRPLVVVHEKLFVGNAKTTVAALMAHLGLAEQ